MDALIHDLFYPLSNTIMSGLMIVVFVYWIFAFFGIGFDDFDLGLEGATIDADTDVDTESDVSAEGEHTDNVLMRFLKFINVGKVPFMLVLSTLKFFTWVFSLLTTKLTIAGSWGWKSVFILIPCLLVAVFFTKWATNPIAKFLKKTGYHGEEETEFLGRSGKMLSTIKDKGIGSAEFIIDGDPVKLNVVSHSGEEIKYGELVMITDESKDNNVYYVTKEITIDQY